MQSLTRTPASKATISPFVSFCDDQLPWSLHGHIQPGTLAKHQAKKPHDKTQSHKEENIGTNCFQWGRIGEGIFSQPVELVSFDVVREGQGIN